MKRLPLSVLAGAGLLLLWQVTSHAGTISAWDFGAVLYKLPPDVKAGLKGQDTEHLHDNQRQAIADIAAQADAARAAAPDNQQAIDAKELSDILAVINGHAPVETPPAVTPAAQPATQPAPLKRIGPMRIGTNFWQIDWGGSDPFKDGFNNVTGDNPWREDFLGQMNTYACLRFMDFGRTNGAEQIHSPDWANRKQKSDRNQNPMAYEWMIDLCNRTGKNMWVCIPHNATPDYWRNLATLIRDTLDPKLKCYVEYSNETWNEQFSQHQYCVEQGERLKLWRPKHDLNKDGTLGNWVPGLVGLRFHVYQAARIGEVFDDVFGDQKDRIVKVIAGQASDWVTYILVEAAADPAINPKGIQFDAYAIAPYFGAGLNGADGDIMNQMRQAIASQVANIRAVEGELRGTGKWAKIDHLGQYNLRLISYEGGQHILENARAFAENPGSYEIYREYLDAMSPHFDLFMHYVHSGNWGSMAWGAERSIDQPLDQAHKYRAIVDWVRDHPGANGN
jgi:hypothetical protein